MSEQHNIKHAVSLAHELRDFRKQAMNQMRRILNTVKSHDESVAIVAREVAQLRRELDSANNQ